MPQESQPTKTETAYFAAGCFWGVEDVFQQIDGVIDAESGYMGGKTEKPTYEQVCRGNTGHAETVKVVYDPARVSYKALLKVFFDNHDPTTMNRQGPDVGDQYRTVIFTHTPEQEAAAQISKAAQQERHDAPIATLIEPATGFWMAEGYHQCYLEQRRSGSGLLGSLLGR